MIWTRSFCGVCVFQFAFHVLECILLKKPSHLALHNDYGYCFTARAYSPRKHSTIPKSTALWWHSYHYSANSDNSNICGFRLHLTVCSCHNVAILVSKIVSSLFVCVFVGASENSVCIVRPINLMSAVAIVNGTYSFAPVNRISCTLIVLLINSSHNQIFYGTTLRRRGSYNLISLTTYYS